MKKHIIVIDDCYETAKLLATSLEHTFDSHVKFHTNPFKAIEEVRTTRLEENERLYIVCDYMMPQMDGIELFDEISTLGKSISFMLVTNENDSIVIEEAMRKGVDLFVLKQQGFDVVINQINKIINGDRSISEDIIEVFEVSDVIKGYRVVEKNPTNMKLYTNEEIPKNSLIKLEGHTSREMIYKVDNCRILDDGIEVECSILKAS